MDCAAQGLLDVRPRRGLEEIFHGGQAFIDVVTAKATAVSVGPGHRVDVDRSLGGSQEGAAAAAQLQVALGRVQVHGPRDHDHHGGAGLGERDRAAAGRQLDPLKLELPERRLVELLAESGNLRREHRHGHRT